MGAATRFIQNPGNNAICYYRYSSDAQRDVSIDQQREAAHEYAKARGYHIIKEYDDPACSGTRDDRPAFRRMLYEIEKLRPAYLILWKTDRLSRDRYDAAIAKGRLRKCGVQPVYVAESMPDDDEATQILLESLYEGMAASFIVSHRKNVMRGMKYNAENAFYNGVKMLGYVGQVNHKYEIDPATAPMVRRIFKEYTEGVPMQKICDSLNNAGQKTVRGNRFTVNSLRNILVNRAYGYKEKDQGASLLPVLEQEPGILMQRRAAVILFHLMNKIRPKKKKKMFIKQKPHTIRYRPFFLNFVFAQRKPVPMWSW